MEIVPLISHGRVGLKKGEDIVIEVNGVGEERYYGRLIWASLV